MNQMISPAVLPLDEVKEAPTQLLEYLRNVSRRKWSILGLTVCLTLLAWAVVTAMRPVYRSTVTLFVETGKAKVVSVEEIYSGVSPNREFFQTQAEILKSREIALRVIERMNLTHNVEFDPRQRAPSAWKKWATSIGLEESSALNEESVEKVVLEQFRRRLLVEPVRLSQLIRISFDANDRALAAQIANTTAEVFIETDLESRYQVTQKAADWLNGRISGLKKKLTESENALQAYREKEKIVDAKGVAQSGVSRQLDDLSKGLIDARQRRAEAENALAQVKSLRGGNSSSYESVPAVLRSPLFIEAKRAEGEAERKVSDLSQRYGKEHPRMVQAEGELRAAKENTRRQAETVVAGLNKEYEVARANEQAVERNIGETRGQVQDINRKEYQLGILEREVASNQQVYDVFIGRSKEASATNDLQTPIARIVDRASPGNDPVRPKVTQICIIAALLSLFISVSLAVFLDRIDNTLKTTEDVENKLGVNVLATVPLLLGRKEEAKLAYLADSHSVFSEAIRTARTGVLLSSIDSEKKTLLITSSVPNEGKTTFAMSLAFSHAQTKKVLLIDADMRRPSIAKTLGLPSGATLGLSDFISGTAHASQVIHSMEGSTVKVMPAGNAPPNPLELLLSPKFALALNALRELFDVIVIDTPPVQLVSDALIVAQHTTGVIYVLKADDTPYPLARIGLKKLRRSGAPMLGVVLNQLDFKKADRYYGEYSGYGAYGYKRYYGSKS